MKPSGRRKPSPPRTIGKTEAVTDTVPAPPARPPRLTRPLDHPLDRASVRETLTDEHWLAATIFRRAFERATGRPGNGRIDAQKRVSMIKVSMMPLDYRIVVAFCGAGAEVSDAVNCTIPCHPNAALARMSEALEALRVAIIGLPDGIAETHSKGIGA